MKMEKVIVINARFLTQPLTGVQRFAIEISKRLKETYNGQVICLCPKNIIHKQEAKFLEAKVIGCQEGYLWEQVELPLYLRKIGSPLLINLTNLAPWFYKNKIYSLLDTSFADNKEWFSWKYSLAYNFLIPKLLNSSKAVITISNFSEKKILQHYDFVSRDKIFVIYCGFNKIAPEDVYVSNKENYILSVSSMDPRKNLAGLIEGFNIYSKKNKNISLYIVGGKNRVFSQLDLQLNEKIKLLGRVSDKQLLALYKNAKLFTSLSLYEGFGLPVLEAMSNGVPTLVSDIPVYKELFKGSTFFVDPLAPSSISNGLEKVLKETKLNNKLVDEGYKTCEKFTWDNSVRLLVNVIKNVKKNK